MADKSRFGVADDWEEVLGEADAWRITMIKSKRNLLLNSGKCDFSARIYCDDVAYLLGQIEFLLDLVKAKEDV